MITHKSGDRPSEPPLAEKLSTNIWSHKMLDALEADHPEHVCKSSFQEMVYSARRNLPRALRGTKVRGSEIWRSWVLPVYSQQETLAQLEFCDMQRCREARQAPTFATPRQSLETRKRERGRSVSVAGENISTQLQFCAFHLSRFQLFFMAADSIHVSHCSLIVNSKPAA